MPSDRFTNGGYIVRTTSRVPPQRPYVASHSNQRSGLTEKEKIARQIKKTAAGFDGLAGAFGGGAFGNTTLSNQGNFYSAQLSTDFLELPQSLRERREVYRHFYNADEIVGQAIDLHTELPLSKLRLTTPKPTTMPEGFESPEDYGKYILDFFQGMCKRVKLFQRLITASHHYWLDGTSCIFAEDSGVDVPPEIGHQRVQIKQAVLQEDGSATETVQEAWQERDDREQQELSHYAKNYQGWSRLIILPIDKVKISTFSFTDKVRVELIPADRDRALIQKALNGDPVAEEMVEEIPEEVRQHIVDGKLIPLGTDPDEGSFCYLLMGRKGADQEIGASILDRCIRTLQFRDKLRQAQTSIASRAMTPKRIVWAEGLSDSDVELLREQVDLALVDPDYSIVANYEVHWEEMGSRDRLLDLSSEYEQTERRLLTGLGVTESLMSGEALYSGDRLKLEVINNRYLLYREVLQEYVEEYLFKPVARRKGFVEKNKWGGEVVLYPKLSFTRLPLRDSQDTFDAMYNLYQKGSLSIDVILEMLNIDPSDTRLKIERDVLTVSDATFNEVLRSLYSEVGRVLAEKTDVMERIAKYLKLELKPEEGADTSAQNNRFASEKKPVG